MLISPIATFLLSLSRLSSGVSSGLIYASQKLESKVPLALDIIFTMIILAVGIYLILSKSSTVYSRGTGLSLSTIGLLLVLIFGVLRIISGTPKTKNKFLNRIIQIIEILIIFARIFVMSIPIIAGIGIGKLRNWPDKSFSKPKLFLIIGLGLINFIIKMIRYFNSEY